ncbi:unnamed protein product [Lactuca saligna]|uniref:Uncharacterized protein n=1 Tax=Lactuca saligna TaxID=75948 RepID=A0AA35YXY8_LACSI|nr:unnamed protein product [Lactuca saligna]
MKHGQNMIIDLDSLRYNEVLRPVIECLKYSSLAQALTMVESVSFVHLSKAYSSSLYNKENDIIYFEVTSQKTLITKSHFCRLLGLTSSNALVYQESISSTILIEMFYQMGYTGDIALLSKFSKPFLPPIFNGLFTLLFKSFFEQVAGSDNASMLLYTLIYGLYHGVVLDFGAILWIHLIQSSASASCTHKFLVHDFGQSWSIEL